MKQSRYVSCGDDKRQEKDPRADDGCPLIPERRSAIPTAIPVKQASGIVLLAVAGQRPITRPVFLVAFPVLYVPAVWWPRQTACRRPLVRARGMQSRTATAWTGERFSSRHSGRAACFPCAVNTVSCR